MTCIFLLVYKNVHLDVVAELAADPHQLFDGHQELRVGEQAVV
jgi:hypothetical protein